MKSGCVQRAWDACAKVGLVAEDGSGNKDVEDLFSRIAIVKNNLEQFKDEFIADGNEVMVKEVENMLGIITVGDKR